MNKQELIENIDKNNLPQSIYNLHTELISRENIKLHCNKGCSLCCNQLLVCSKIEWNEIDKFINDNNIIEDIENRNVKLLNIWIEYRTKNWNKIVTGEINPIYDFIGKYPCIFLKNDICQIYPVRPMNCRTMTSTIYYTTENNNHFCGGVRERWEYEKWMNDLFLEMSYIMIINDFFLKLD